MPCPSAARRDRFMRAYGSDVSGIGPSCAQTIDPSDLGPGMWVHKTVVLRPGAWICLQSQSRES
jgi:hypothetical protein